MANLKLKEFLKRNEYVTPGQIYLVKANVFLGNHLKITKRRLYYRIWSARSPWQVPSVSVRIIRPRASLLSHTNSRSNLFGCSGRPT